MRWILARLRPVGRAWTAALDARLWSSGSSCRPPTGAPGSARARRGHGGARYQPELGLATLPAPRALPVSRLLATAASRPIAAAPTASTSSACSVSRTPSRPSLPAAPASPAWGRCCAARSSTSCSSGSTSTVPPRRRRPRSRALVEATGPPAAREVADLRAMVERFAGSAFCARVARAQRVRTELPFAFTPAAPGCRRTQPAGQRRGRRARDRGRRRPAVVDSGATPSTAATPSGGTGESYSTQRLVYALAGTARRRAPRRGRALLPRATRRGRPRPSTRPPTPSTEARAARARPRRGRGPLRAPAEPHLELCGDLPRPRRPLLLEGGSHPHAGRGSTCSVHATRP